MGFERYGSIPVALLHRSSNGYLPVNRDMATTKPHIAIAAGHAGHLHVLAAKRSHGAFAALLMSPSLPYRLFDGIICPAHDRPPKRPNILSTFGTLNRIEPYSASPDHNDLKGLVMLGGVSAHYHWDLQQIVSQVRQLSIRTPQQQWHIICSRRTPQDTLDAIATLDRQNVFFLDEDTITPNWLCRNLAHYNEIWVTPDSASMIFEAMATKRPVGVMNLSVGSSRKHSRVREEVERLIRSGDLATNVNRPIKPKNGAHNLGGIEQTHSAAHWLMNQYGEACVYEYGHSTNLKSFPSK